MDMSQIELSSVGDCDKVIAVAGGLLSPGRLVASTSASRDPSCVRLEGLVRQSTNSLGLTRCLLQQATMDYANCLSSQVS